jgi:broad specificity phosphatase PhoE
MYALYVTHPEVAIDPAVPVPRWGLSETGRKRAEAFARHPLVRGVRQIVSSTETKAVQLAQILGVANRIPFIAEPAFGENDRSATGYVPSERFEQLADAFFTHPTESVEGWEPAATAQARIVGAFEATLAEYDPTRPLLFAGHGAVGTLLKCALDGRVISRDEDQSRIAHKGGGNVLVIRIADRALLSDWVPMEALPEALTV